MNLRRPLPADTGDSVEGSPPAGSAGPHQPHRRKTVALPGSLPFRTGLTLLPALLLGLLLLFVLFGPMLWPDPVHQDLLRSLTPPGMDEPLGRDHLGRSVLARLAHGTRLSLLLAVLSVATATAVGSFWGIVAAWRGMRVDALVNGVAETIAAIPSLLVVLLFSAMGQGRLWMLYLAIALTQSTEYFRVVRARSSLILAGPGTQTARLLGLGPAHLLRRHLWPELRPVLLTLSTFGIGTSVLILSTLGYVGVGLTPPTPELGIMIVESLPYWSQAPWIVAAPMTVLAVTLFALFSLRREGVST